MELQHFSTLDWVQTQDSQPTCRPLLWLCFGFCVSLWQPVVFSYADTSPSFHATIPISHDKFVDLGGARRGELLFTFNTWQYQCQVLRWDGRGKQFLQNLTWKEDITCVTWLHEQIILKWILNEKCCENVQSIQVAWGRVQFWCLMVSVKVGSFLSNKTSAGCQNVLLCAVSENIICFTNFMPYFFGR